MTPTDATTAPGRALLAHAGSTIFGPQWQCELAQALGRSDRTVRYWLAGTVRIPASTWPQLAAIARDRGAELAGLTKMLSTLERNPP